VAERGDADVIAETARRRRRRRLRVTEAHDLAEMRDTLAPVAEALATIADRRARAQLADATNAAGAVLASAREEASRILQAARAEGIEAAERVRATQHALARRQAREMVLAARRQAFETLRTVALDELAAYAGTREGRRLSDMVTAAVCERAGARRSGRRR
jgi:vacuolar-type H+-ATPase subunit E/Vma4